MRLLGLMLGVALLQFTSGVNLVEVYATVTDEQGQPVRGLTRADFQVLEDGRPEVVSTFVAAEFPLAVALALDRSWSMAGRPLALAKSAARTFLGALRPEDRAMLLAFGNDLEVIAPLSADRTAQQRALDDLDVWGTTSLHDAIIEAIDAIPPERGRRALIVLSDGVDRYSRASAADVLMQARRSDVLIYPVALARQRPELFAELAVLTGGRSFHLRNPNELDRTFTAIAEELRFQYLLGYSPSRPIDGSDEQWRSIRVRVDRRGLRVRARDGYVAR
jgi:Ca-activated chloride channel family protein